MYCFLPFGFTNVTIFVADSFGSYWHCVKSIQIRSFFWSVFSRIRTEYGPEKTPYLDTFHAVSIFFGADLEYPNSLRHNRISWSGLRYFNFEPNLKLWWRRARDFDGSQNPITSSFCLRDHFHPYIQYEKLLENYSLLVYQ